MYRCNQQIAKVGGYLLSRGLDASDAHNLHRSLITQRIFNSHTASVLSDDMESNLSPHETSTRHHRKNANTHGRIEMTLPSLYSEFSSYVISAVLMFSFGQKIT